jgi:hypothetical protein
MNARSEHVSSVRMAKIAQSYPVRTTLAFHVFFLTLLVVNVVRTLRHPMWRDEMGTFQIATASASLWELLSKLQYTTHPGLWYSLVWLATRFTSDPTSMAIMHIVIAIAVWTVIFRWSPFETVEKCLLLLSYFLFWEYFVISRNYALLALIGFAFVALQQHRPQQNVIPWLLLGLLANTHVLGAIWSIALGTTLVIKRRRLTPGFVTGAAIYLVLLAFSVKTAAPAPDFGPWATDVRFDTARFGQALLFPLGAFAPINPAWLADAVSFVAHAGAAPVPHFWNPNPFRFHCGYPSRHTAPAQVGTRADRAPCAVLDDHPGAAPCLRIRDLLCWSSVVLEYLEFSRLLSPSRHRIPGVCRQRLGGTGGAPVDQIIDLCFPSASSDQCNRRCPHTELGIDTFFAGAQCCRVAKDEWPIGRRPHRIAGRSSLDRCRVPRTTYVFLGMRVSRHVRRL